MQSRWMLLRDVATNTVLLNLDTKERVSVSADQFKGHRWSGLRREVVVYDDASGLYEFTGETLPITEEIADELDTEYQSFDGNGWHYEWPHVEVETTTPDQVEALRANLLAQLAPHPYEFQIIGLQRRFVMYYSDGGVDSQQYFLDYIPTPDSSPFKRNGELKVRYVNNWDHLCRDNQIPLTAAHKGKGVLRPCLYRGPAWAVRLLVDDQQIFRRCMIFVDDDGKFLFSSWCQRHGQKKDGINLQLGIFSFDGWIVGSGIARMIGERVFKPKKTKIVTVRAAALKEQAKAVPEAFEVLLQRQLDAMPKPAGPVYGDLGERFIAYAADAGGGVAELPAQIDAFLESLAVTPLAREIQLPVTRPYDGLTEQSLERLKMLVTAGVPVRDRGTGMSFLTTPVKAVFSEVPEDSCVTTDWATYQFHLALDKVAIDYAWARELLQPAVDAVLEQRRGDEPLPELTPAVLGLAIDAAAARKAQIVAAQPVCDAPAAVAAVVAPSAPTQIGDFWCRFTAQGDDSVLLELLLSANGKLQEPVVAYVSWYGRETPTGIDVTTTAGFTDPADIRQDAGLQPLFQHYFQEMACV